METLDARELVARFQAGDRADAFTEIYSRYRDPIFHYLYRRTANAPLSEDLTQDVFVKALRNLDTWDWQGKDPSAWLHVVARNTLADHYKAARRRPVTSVPDYFGDLEPVATHREHDPAAAVADRLRNDALLAALWQLTPVQRECIALRYIQGRSVAETAKAMGRHEGAIKALTARATRSLAHLLEGEGLR